MRSLGEFVGHVWKRVRADPSQRNRERITLRRSVEEEDRGDVTLRRTTIEEIEIRRPPESTSPDSTPPDSTPPG